jgi:hypothetical protein
MGKIYKNTFLIIFFTFILSFRLSGATQEDTTNKHELTIFVIPSHRDIDWQSPSSLSQTTTKSWISSKFVRHSYYIGHLFIELSSSLLDKPVVTSVRSVGNKEKLKLLYKEKIGMAIIGAPLKGRMESADELTSSIDFILKKGRSIAFITYSINEIAAKRIIEFIEGFSKSDTAGRAPCEIYGGGYWPRYKGEGAGCSAFGMVVMEVAGLKHDYPEWIHSVNIPADLVGGQYNNYIKVKNRTIKNTTEWNDGSGTANMDYFPFSIYDPTLIYKWIIKTRTNCETDTSATISGFQPAIITRDQGIIPGLYMDARNIQVPPDEPILKERDIFSIFAVPTTTQSRRHK